MKDGLDAQSTIEKPSKVQDSSFNEINGQNMSLINQLVQSPKEITIALPIVAERDRIASPKATMHPDFEKIHSPGEPEVGLYSPAQIIKKKRGQQKSRGDSRQSK